MSWKRLIAPPPGEVCTAGHHVQMHAAMTAVWLAVFKHIAVSTACLCPFFPGAFGFTAKPAKRLQSPPLLFRYDQPRHQAFGTIETLHSTTANYSEFQEVKYVSQCGIWGAQGTLLSLLQS